MSCIRLSASFALALAAALPHHLVAVARAQGSSPPVTAAPASDLQRAIDTFNARHFADARVALQDLVRREPKNAGAAFWLGRSFLAETSWDAAADWLGKAAEMEPRNSNYHLWYGNAVGSQAERASKFRQPFLAKRVQHEFERAVELDPNNLDARDGLMSFYLQAPGFMGGSEDKARVQANEIRARDPQRGALAMASVLLHAKDTAGAEREFRGAVALTPDSAGPYFRLVQFYVVSQRWDSAFAVADRLLARQPDNRGARYTIGRLGAQSGQHLDRAEAALREYLGYTPKPNEPTLAGAHWRLGMVLERRGDPAGARKEYQAALALQPDLKAAKDALAKLK
jgi:tetratricopeptide (TPR) repeat protein